jgi:hypothetical protein
MGLISKLPIFKKNQQNTADLNDLLKENAGDFEMVEGLIQEKNSLSYENSLHTKHL